IIDLRVVYTRHLLQQSTRLFFLQLHRHMLLRRKIIPYSRFIVPWQPPFGMLFPSPGPVLHFLPHLLLLPVGPQPLSPLPQRCRLRPQIYPTPLRRLPVPPLQVLQQDPPRYPVHHQMMDHQQQPPSSRPHVILHPPPPPPPPTPPRLHPPPRPQIQAPLPPPRILLQPPSLLPLSPSSSHSSSSSQLPPLIQPLHYLPPTLLPPSPLLSLIPHPQSVM